MFLCWFYLLQSNLDIPETYKSSDRIYVRPGLGPGLSIAGGMTDLLPYGIKFSLSLSQCLVPDEAIEKNSPLRAPPPAALEERTLTVSSQSDTRFPLQILGY